MKAELDLRYELVGECAYVPSVVNEDTLRPLIALMEFFHQHIDLPNATFADLGSGTGTIVFAAREMGFGRAYGIEIDPERAAYAQASQATLGYDGRAQIVCGDWAGVETYLQAGICFQDFGAVYIYPSPGRLGQALNMVCSRSHVGTLLAIKESNENARATIPDALEHLASIIDPVAMIDVYRKR